MRTFHLLAMLLILSFSGAAWSAGGLGGPAEDPELQKGRALIERQDWAAATEVLATYTRTHAGSADAYNLLGYGYRHLQRYDESLSAYHKALALDPNHRAAHEYLGEAYLQLGQLDKAKEQLDALDRICFFPCEEYRDLKKAYEAARQATAR
jgi:tetratricopeptide (TPR) repeat protein